MYQLQFYSVAFLFLLLSIVFAGSPTCSRRPRGSSTKTPTYTVASPAITAVTPVTLTAPTQAISSNSVAQATPDPEPGSTSDTDIQAYLDAHNSVRAQHGAVDLTWSDNLASKAQEWANGCVFQHSGGQLGPFGENLAAGTGSYDIANAVGYWAAEVSAYDPSNPVPSHFTQIVWKATTQVGCAVQTCSGIFSANFGPAQFYVCEYYVQGNVIGSFSQNVQV